MNYQCQARNQTAFIQQLVRYVAAGYRFYVVGYTSKRLPAEETDRRIIEKYKIDKSPQQRSRAKQRGEANLQYIRLDDFWVILTTKGEHPFFEAHQDEYGRALFKDLRKSALRVGPYAISSKMDGRWKKKKRRAKLKRYRVEPNAIGPKIDGMWEKKKNKAKLKRYRVRVTLSRDEYKDLIAYYEEKAAHWSVENMGEEISKLGQKYLPYKPVRDQLIQLVKRTNRKRKETGYKSIPYSVLNLPSYRKTETVFVEE